MKRLMGLAVCVVLAAGFPARAGSPPLPDPVAERISSTMATSFRSAGWTITASAEDDGKTRVCLTAVRRVTHGSERTVTEMRGCAGEPDTYAFDAVDWVGQVTAVVRVRGDRFRQVFVDGDWHGTGVLGFPKDRLRIRLTFQGDGLVSPEAHAGVCTVYYAPPFVDPCVFAAASRPASVGGWITMAGERETVGRGTGSMRWWTAA